jgi:hypothetical protein
LGSLAENLSLKFEVIHKRGILLHISNFFPHPIPTPPTPVLTGNTAIIRQVKEMIR